MVQTRQPTNPPDFATIIAQQLQNIILNIVTQVTNNLNNGNGNGNGRGNNGCTYKGFMACGPQDFNETGGAIRRMLRATQLATIQAAILTAGILTDEVVCSGTLAKASEKRKERDEASKSKNARKDEKKAKRGRGFVAAVAPRRENGNFPKCARCKGFHAKKGPCIVCYHWQRPGHMARDYRTPVRHAEPIQAVRPRAGQRACYECGSLDHLRLNCPKWNADKNQKYEWGEKQNEAFQTLKTICVTPPEGAWMEYVSGGVTLLCISSTKHKEQPLR
nr:reverse transcriptase domain-containing protein [Tanacetum cinerariifolium]